MNSQLTKIKDLPRQERPRERLIDKGAENLSSSELLAILLRSGSSGKSALSLANQLLKKYGSLRSLAETSAEELQEFRGIGPAKSAQLSAGLTLALRLAREEVLEKPKFEDPESVYNYLRLELRDLKKEVFIALLLDGKRKLINREQISQGTLTSSLVHPREVFRPAIRSSAAALIFVHNHPSGDPEPSEEDLKITDRLVEVGNIVGIQVLDHIIIGKRSFKSLKELGHLNSNS